MSPKGHKKSNFAKEYKVEIDIHSLQQNDMSIQDFYSAMLAFELLVEKVRLKSHDDKKIVGPSVFASTHSDSYIHPKHLTIYSIRSLQISEEKRILRVDELMSSEGVAYKIFSITSLRFANPALTISFGGKASQFTLYFNLVIVEKSQRSKDNGFQEQESVKVIVFVAASTTAEYQNSLSLLLVNLIGSLMGKGKVIEEAQVTTVQIVQLYQEQFEALMNKVKLSEAYAVSLFIGGLKDEISMSVRMFKPNTLTDVYCLAKIQEATFHVLKTKQTPLLTTPKAHYTNSYANRSMTYPPKTTTTTLAIPAPPNMELTKSAYVQPRKQLTQKEIADKRAKNLCFYYDEKFVP
ncbi:hypothetical protein Tco_0289800 [Tanacetum coccineum]